MSSDSSLEESPADHEEEFTQEYIKGVLETIGAIKSLETLDETILNDPSKEDTSLSENLEKNMVKEIKEAISEWRRVDNSSCTYLLLDSGVTNKIKWDDATSAEKKWRSFVSSIFYVGRGQDSTIHLDEAKNLLWTSKMGRQVDKAVHENVKRILHIWSEGNGVIIVKAFESITSNEASTRKAVIIDTLGLPSLSNMIVEKHHDKEVVNKLRLDKKILSFGKYLLFQAMKNFLDFPYDLFLSNKRITAKCRSPSQIAAGSSKTEIKQTPPKENVDSTEALALALECVMLDDRLRDRTPGRSGGDQNIARNENNDFAINRPKRTPGNSNKETPTKAPIPSLSELEQKVNKMKEILKTLAENKKILATESLKKELLDYPSDVEISVGLEESMENEFKSEKAGRSDISQNCCTYLLLDSGVINEIQCWEDATKEVKWTTFVRSIFYVGKGLSSRPRQHLERAKVLLMMEVENYVKDEVSNAGKQIQRILQIWSEGKGVIIVKAFESIISEEAFTREAVIIDTLGLPSLCNKNHGTYYDGKVEALKEDEKSRFGKYLLLKAMNNFKTDVEQITPLKA